MAVVCDLSLWCWIHIMINVINVHATMVNPIIYILEICKVFKQIILDKNINHQCIGPEEILVIKSCGYWSTFAQTYHSPSPADAADSVDCGGVWLLLLPVWLQLRVWATLWSVWLICLCLCKCEHECEELQCFWPLLRREKLEKSELGTVSGSTCTP